MIQPQPRYALFAGDHFYPEGGVRDLRGTFNTLKEMFAAVSTRDTNGFGRHGFMIDGVIHEWVNALDMETGLMFSRTRPTEGWKIITEDGLSKDFDDMEEEA